MSANEERQSNIAAGRTYTTQSGRDLYVTDITPGYVYYREGNGAVQRRPTHEFRRIVGI